MAPYRFPDWIAHLGEVLLGLGVLGMSGATVDFLAIALRETPDPLAMLGYVIDVLFYLLAMITLSTGAMLSDRKWELQCDACCVRS